MKKSRKKAVIPLLLLAAAGLASAQSSVTVFGIVDMSVRQIKNGSAGKMTVLARDGLANNRIGFRGVEDLGDGLQAGFWLEHGFNPDSGTAANAKFWNRRTTVSLISKTAGELRLGRDYTPAFLVLAAFDPFGTNGMGDFSRLTSTLGSNAGTLVRADNMAIYYLPGGLGGFYGQAALVAGEGKSVVNDPTSAGGNAENKHQGLRLGYQAGPLNIAVGYGNTDIASGSDWRMLNGGASYDLGVVKLFGQVSSQKYASRKQLSSLMGATAPLGAQGTLRFAYGRSDQKGSAANNANAFSQSSDSTQLALGYVHDLSKRTAIHSTFVRIGNKGNAALVVDGTLTGMAAGGSSTGFELGIRHLF